MIKRRAIMQLVAEKANKDRKIVSCLGRISRDLYQFTDKTNKNDCFYLVGAMGSALPFGLGLAIARPDKKIWALEGDGSVLMNLGALVTFRRYMPPNLTLFIIDNGQYETTGGQPSQPDGLQLSEISRSIGLSTASVEDISELKSLIQNVEITGSAPEVIVIKTLPDAVSPRITKQPPELAQKFKQNLC
jgi:thiamine pyrophosphate-dependent acetolactate synthase large subunit-like protein